MDVFTAIAKWIAELICRLSQPLFLGPVRLAMLWLLGFLACRYSFDSGTRSSPLQWAAFAGAIFFGMVIPLGPLYGWLTGGRNERVIKSLLFFGALAMNVLGPALLPPLLTPQFGRQIKLRALFYLFVISALTLNVIYAGISSLLSKHV